MSNQHASQQRLEQFAMIRPENPAQLHRFVQVVFGLEVTREVLEPDSTPPLAYLDHAFFERGDALVWANRGGGKTLLGAVATLLDLIFKPGVQVRILGGSLEQSEKMYEHLLTLLERPMLKDGPGILAGAPTQRRIELANGSAVELLAQSHRSVRGTRVHKLRCDEVEEFQSDVWQAAQLITRSGRCGDWFVRGSVEALSTAHRPHGLMNRLIERSRRGERLGKDSGPSPKRADNDTTELMTKPASADGGLGVFRWNALDVIERCSPTRSCEACVLWDPCRGRAKRANGFVAVDDLVAQHRRTDQETWAAEMLCQRPTRSDSVYPNFEPRIHVRGEVGLKVDQQARCIGGMDFGVRSPTVFLWAMVKSDGGGIRTVEIVDEYIEPGRTLDEHMDRIEKQSRDHGLPTPTWLGVDPAGDSRNAHSGLSDLQVLRKRGYTVRSRVSKIAEGIRIVRRRLDRQTLRVHPRCPRLIQALEQYHFDIDHPERDQPVKDGPDHACDALRYLLINEEHAEPAAVRSYL